MYLLMTSILFLVTSSAHGDIKHYIAGSLESIESMYRGQPFLLVLWSVDCPPCMEELKRLQQARETFKSMNLVLIATDKLSEISLVTNTLRTFRLLDADNWIFSDHYVEKLRFDIDPDWRGVLPHTYFYPADHRRVGVTGALSSEQIHRWFMPPGLID